MNAKILSRPIRWITALCLVGLVASTHAGTHQIEGRIVGVHDGDTITLLDADSRQHKSKRLGEAPGSGALDRITNRITRPNDEAPT